MSVVVPAEVELLLAGGVAQEIAVTFGELQVYPQRVLVDGPAEPSLSWPPSSRRFPGWPGPVLVLSDENQGVCSWGCRSAEAAIR